jgi:hypothetical protein
MTPEIFLMLNDGYKKRYIFNKKRNSGHNKMIMDMP